VKRSYNTCAALFVAACRPTVPVYGPNYPSNNGLTIAVLILATYLIYVSDLSSEVSCSAFVLFEPPAANLVFKQCSRHLFAGFLANHSLMLKDATARPGPNLQSDLTAASSAMLQLYCGRKASSLCGDTVLSNDHDGESGSRPCMRHSSSNTQELRSPRVWHPAA
jgi:hypothetical protein